jgi:hypothetical protein
MRETDYSYYRKIMFSDCHLVYLGIFLKSVATLPDLS